VIAAQAACHGLNNTAPKLRSTGSHGPRLPQTYAWIAVVKRSHSELLPDAKTG